MAHVRHSFAWLLDRTAWGHIHTHSDSDSDGWSTPSPTATDTRWVGCHIASGRYDVRRFARELVSSFLTDSPDQQRSAEFVDCNRESWR